MVYVKGDTNIFERILEHGVVHIHYSLRGSMRFARFYSYSSAVFVGAAHKNHVFPKQPKVTDIDVCREVSAGKVPDVQWTIGVWKGSGDEEPVFRISESGHASVGFEAKNDVETAIFGQSRACRKAGFVESYTIIKP